MRPHRLILISTYQFLLLSVPTMFLCIVFASSKLKSGGSITVFIIMFGFFSPSFPAPSCATNSPPFHHSPLSITPSSFTISALPTWQMTGLLCPPCLSSVETSSVIIFQAELGPKHQCGSGRALCLDLSYRP